MTRDEALLKLIALEPITRSALLVVTGWPTAETLASAQRLLRQGVISEAAGHFCLPAVAAALNDGLLARRRPRATSPMPVGRVYRAAKPASHVPARWLQPITEHAGVTP
jgi:hypothetical protein